MAVLPKLIYRFNPTPLKIPFGFFFGERGSEIDKLFLKFIWKCKRSRIADMILIKKNKIGRLTLPHYKSMVIRVWCLALRERERHRSIGYKGESRNKPWHLWSMVSAKGAKTIKWRKKSLSNKWYWDKCTSTYQKNEVETLLHTIYDKLTQDGSYT